MAKLPIEFDASGASEGQKQFSAAADKVISDAARISETLQKASDGVRRFRDMFTGKFVAPDTFGAIPGQLLKTADALKEVARINLPTQGLEAYQAALQTLVTSASQQWAKLSDQAARGRDVGEKLNELKAGIAQGSDLASTLGLTPVAQRFRELATAVEYVSAAQSKSSPSFEAMRRNIDSLAYGLESKVIPAYKTAEQAAAVYAAQTRNFGANITPFGAGLGLENKDLERAQALRAVQASLVEGNLELRKQIEFEKQLVQIEAERKAVEVERLSAQKSAALNSVAQQNIQLQEQLRIEKELAIVEIERTQALNKQAKKQALDSVFNFNARGATGGFTLTNTVPVPAPQPAQISAWQKFKSAFAEANSEVDRGSNSFLNFNRASLGTWTQLTVGLTGLYAIRRGFTESIDAISGYEKQLAILQAVTRASAEDQKALADAARNAGAGGIFSATEAAAGLVELSKAGFTAREAIAALPGVIDFAVNAQISLAEASDTAAKIIRQFNLEASDTGRVADVLTNVANKTTTDVRNLATSFKYVGPAANSFNIDIETTAASLGVLAQRGIEGSLAGTNLRRIILELAAPTKEAANRLEALGNGLSEKVNPASNDFVEILKRLRDAQLNAADARTIFDQRSAIGALILAQNADAIADLTKNTKENAGVSHENAEIINNTLVGAWERLKSAMQEVAIEGGESGVLGILRSLTDGFKDSILYLTGFDYKMTGSLETAKTYAGALQITGAVIAGLAAQQILFSRAIAGTTIAMIGAERAAIALTAAAPWIGWTAVVVAAAAAIIHFADSEDSVAEKAKKAQEALDNQSQATRVLKEVTLSYAEAWNQVYNAIGDPSKLSAAYSTVAQEIKRVLTEIDKAAPGSRISLDRLFQLDKTGQTDKIKAKFQAEIDKLVDLDPDVRGWQKFVDTHFNGLGKAELEAAKQHARDLISIKPEFTTVSREEAAKILQADLTMFENEAKDQAPKKIKVNAQLDFGNLSDISSDAIKQNSELIKKATDYLDAEEIAVQGDSAALYGLHARRRLETSLASEQAKQLRALGVAYKEQRDHIIASDSSVSESAEALKLLNTEYERLQKSITDNTATKQQLDLYQQQEVEYKKLTDAIAGTEKAQRALRTFQESNNIELEHLDEELKSLQKVKTERTAGMRIAELNAAAQKRYAETVKPLKFTDATMDQDIEVWDKATQALDDYKQKMAQVVGQQELEKNAVKVMHGWWLNIVQDLKWVKKQSEEYAHSLHQTNMAQKLVDDVKLEREQLYMTNDEREKSIRLRELEKYSIDKSIRGYDQMYETMSRELDLLARDKSIATVAKGWSSAFGQAAEDIVMASGKISDVIHNLVLDVERQFLHEMFTKPFTDSLSKLFQNAFGGIFGNVFGGGQSQIPYYIAAPSSAFGNVVGPQGVQNFAFGDIATGLSTVSIGRKRGAIGEKSWEGIMPLGRDSQGRLGVHIISAPDSAAGNQTPTRVDNRKITMNVYPRDSSAFRRTNRQTLRDLKRDS